MRVVLWGELFWPYLGGAEIFAARLLEALQPRGYEFAVVTSHDNHDLPDVDAFQGIPIYRFPFRQALEPRQVERQLIVRRRIAAFLRQWVPDLIHLNGVTPSAFYCINAIKSEPVPLLVRLNQELRVHQHSHVRGTLLEHALLRANWVTTVSALLLDHARALVPAIGARSSVIYNGVESDSAPSVSPFTQRILCLGRLAPQKGFDIAIDAFAIMRRDWPGARLVIAGDGSERGALEEQARRGGISDAVEFLGWVPPQEVPTLLTSVAMMLIPSREEGLPNVALQAAAAGVPIVSTRAGGLPEVVRHGETGLLVGGTAEACASALATLLAQPTLAREMGLSGWRLAREQFDQARCIDAYDRLYRGLGMAPS